MHLQEYFSTEPRGAKQEMAAYLGITKTWMALLIAKKRVPSALLSNKIDAATGGLVTKKELRPDLFS